MKKSGDSGTIIYRAWRKDGKLVVIQSDITLITLPSVDYPVQLAITSDVTARVMYEDRQKELLDNMACGAALYEYDGKSITALHINKRYQELVGRDVKKYDSKSVISAIHPDDIKKVIKEINSAIAEERPAKVTARVSHGDGGYRTFKIVGNITPKSQSTYSIYATYEIIPDEKLINNTLAVALESFMRSSRDLSYVKDANLRYVSVSDTFVKASGKKSAAEVIGKTDRELVTKDEAERFETIDKRVISSKRAEVDYTETVGAEKNKIIYAKTSKYPIMDQNGNVIGIYGITRDDTETHFALERLKLLTDNIPGGIATYKITPKSIELVYCNDGYFVNSGLTKEEFLEKMKSPFSFIVKEDLPKVLAAISEVRQGKQKKLEVEYRCNKINGGIVWFLLKGNVKPDQNGDYFANVVQLDVTDEKEAQADLRVSEEQFRIAAKLSGRIVVRYDIINDRLYGDTALLVERGFNKEITNAEEALLNANIVGKDSIPEYKNLFERARAGEKNFSGLFSLRLSDKGIRCFRAEVHTVFDMDCRPTEAIVVLFDVTDLREKEAVYKKWQQSLENKNADKYTLFQCNLSRNVAFDLKEGNLLDLDFSDESKTFNERTLEYAEAHVATEDREAYEALLNSDTLLDGYYKGDKIKSMDYREATMDGERWIRLTVELVEYPESTEVKAYMMYEDIDEIKQKELQTLKRAETDWLTGILNRTTFADKANAIMAERHENSRHALLLLDMDGFKRVNDVFGHAAGDKILKEVAKIMDSALRPGDLLGRLGGDEFIMFLKNLPDDSVAAAKARELCDLMRQSYSAEIKITASVGVAVSPRDGFTFDELYKKSDSALYHVKGSGKDGYVFYRDDLKYETLEMSTSPTVSTEYPLRELKRHMLIVDDSVIDNKLLANIFKDDYIVDNAYDGESALIRLNHYGNAISVVLLDLFMPYMSGFDVLSKMQKDSKLQTIPVLVISGSDDEETSIKAIKCGATDFVTKPVEPELLKTRVRSAITKAQNTELRAQNKYLQLQNAEVTRCRRFIERTGLAVMENDWIKGTFTYDPSVAAHIAGIYDNRRLWRILLSDMVTDTKTVKEMQEFVKEIAETPEKTEGRKIVKLRAPNNKYKDFIMTVYKDVNSYGLADKLLLTFAEKAEEEEK